jgi:hypothetical protein
MILKNINGLGMKSLNMSLALSIALGLSTAAFAAVAVDGRIETKEVAKRLSAELAKPDSKGHEKAVIEALFDVKTGIARNLNYGPGESADIVVRIKSKGGLVVPSKLQITTRGLIDDLEKVSNKSATDKAIDFEKLAGLAFVLKLNGRPMTELDVQLLAVSLKLMANAKSSTRLNLHEAGKIMTGAKTGEPAYSPEQIRTALEIYATAAMAAKGKSGALTTADAVDAAVEEHAKVTGITDRDVIAKQKECLGSIQAI